MEKHLSEALTMPLGTPQKLVEGLLFFSDAPGSLVETLFHLSEAQLGSS